MNGKGLASGKRAFDCRFGSFSGIPILAVLFLTTVCGTSQLPAQSALITLNSFDLYDGRPAGLLLGKDANFYAVTSGTVTRFSTNGVLTRIYLFTNGVPFAGLVQARDGYLYGTTFSGGSNALGSIFQLSTNGNLTEIHSFSDRNEGRRPITQLVEAHDHFLYGATDLGGTNDTGTIFRISTDGDFASLYSFTDNGRPRGLVEANDGNLYGTTLNGGIGYGGSIFKISTNGHFADVHVFTGGPEGWQPTSGLVQANDGFLYGTTSAGSTYNLGSIFRVSTNGQIMTVHSFAPHEGREPFTELVQTKEGALYGAAERGGFSAPSSCGTLFRVTPNGTFTILYTFTNGPDGGQPAQALVEGPDRQLYGTTSGGSISCQCSGPTVFRLTLTGQPAPLSLAITITNQVFQLRWNSRTGAVYQPQYTSDLIGQQWTHLGPELTASAAILSTTDAVVNAPQRFYRVLWLR